MPEKEFHHLPLCSLRFNITSAVGTFNFLVTITIIILLFFSKSLFLCSFLSIALKKNAKMLLARIQKLLIIAFIKMLNFSWKIRVKKYKIVEIVTKRIRFSCNANFKGGNSCWASDFSNTRMKTASSLKLWNPENVQQSYPLLRK